MVPPCGGEIVMFENRPSVLRVTPKLIRCLPPRRTVPCGWDGVKGIHGAIVGRRSLGLQRYVALGACRAALAAVSWSASARVLPNGPLRGMSPSEIRKQRDARLP
jgi:hypothetical protein